MVTLFFTLYSAETPVYMIISAEYKDFFPYSQRKCLASGLIEHYTSYVTTADNYKL